MIRTAMLSAIVLVPLLIAGGLVWWLLAKRKKEAARIAAMSPSERKLHDAAIEHQVAVREHQAAVSAANSMLQLEIHQYHQRVAQAESAVSAAQQVGQRELGRYMGLGSGVILYENQIAWASAGGQWTYHPLHESVRAEIDASGTIYATEQSTLGRMALGGIAMGKAGVVAGAAARKTTVNDERELYLNVEGPAFAFVVACHATHGAYARQLAAQIMTAGRQMAALESQRPQLVEIAQSALDVARADSRRVDGAQQALSAAQAATGRIDAANQILAGGVN